MIILPAKKEKKIVYGVRGAQIMSNAAVTKKLYRNIRYLSDESSSSSISPRSLQAGTSFTQSVVGNFIDIEDQKVNNST